MRAAGSGWARPNPHSGRVTKSSCESIPAPATLGLPGSSASTSRRKLRRYRGSISISIAARSVGPDCGTSGLCGSKTVHSRRRSWETTGSGRPADRSAAGQREDRGDGLRVTCGRFGRALFPRADRQETAEEMCVRFTVKPGPELQELRIPVASHPLWKGHRIVSLRLDPNTAKRRGAWKSSRSAANKATSRNRPNGKYGRGTPNAGHPLVPRCSIRFPSEGTCRPAAAQRDGSTSQPRSRTRRSQWMPYLPG